MQNLYSELNGSRPLILRAVFSSPREGAEYARIVLRPALFKGYAGWQAERFAGVKVFHLNLKEEELLPWLESEGIKYRQITVIEGGRTLFFSTRAGGGYKKSESKNNLKNAPVRGNDRKKEYLLEEGENIPPLVDLGVFTEDFKVKADKRDKFRQINRFAELLDDALKKSDKEELVFVDFGCGKSYLTFIAYYYLAVKRGRRVKIVGYDLKADVVAYCNSVAEKYGYDGLSFFAGDVSKGGLYEGEVDGVLTLHACDTATDYALAYAVQKGAEYIFSVPCCQHEVNGSISAGGDFDLLLAHGLFKERFSALLTDAVRAELLKEEGYSVDVLEFVDFSHSPKNVMLRARKTKKPTRDFSRVEALMQKYKFTQRLYELLK